MRLHKRLVWICAGLTLISLIVSVILNYIQSNDEFGFWINVCLAIFGSAFLASLTAILSYLHERRRTLEEFLYHSDKLLRKLSKYQDNLSIEQKMEFFLEYDEMDKSLWDSAFGNIDFIFNRFQNDQEWIYEKIYQPLNQFSQAVSERERHFRFYRSGMVRNLSVMKVFVQELETFLLECKELNDAVKLDEAEEMESCKLITTETKLVRDILEHLYGKYFSIMYGRHAVKDAKSKEQHLELEIFDVKE